MTNRAVVQNIDLAPTFDSFAGAPTPKKTDGRSLEPLLHGKHPPRWPDIALIEQRGLARHPDDPDYQPGGDQLQLKYVAIRSTTFLYVERRSGDIEYYDLRTDPFELHNIADALSEERLSRLHRELTALVNCHNAAECGRAGYVAQP